MDTPLQAFLRSNGLSALEPLGISSFEHPSLPLVGFKYSQVDSPKCDPVVRWSRGTVLEKGTWNLVAQSFPRFYNWGEGGVDKFDWSDVEASTKEDGSLIILYHYDGGWRVNTSGSFGLCQYDRDKPETWEQLFWRTFEAVGGMKKHLELGLTYVFEICGPDNHNVRKYANPRLFILSAFEGDRELPRHDVAIKAVAISISRPERRQFFNIDEVKAYLAQMAAKDVSFEGVVLRDRNDVRFKCKSLSYIALHHFEDDGGKKKIEHLVRIAVANETDEVLSYLPDMKAELEAIRTTLASDYAELEALWAATKGVAEQKAFAMAIAGNKYKSLLFEARKTATPVKDLWKGAADLIVNKWGKK